MIAGKSDKEWATKMEAEKCNTETDIEREKKMDVKEEL